MHKNLRGEIDAKTKPDKKTLTSMGHYTNQDESNPNHSAAIRTENDEYEKLKKFLNKKIAILKDLSPTFGEFVGSLANDATPGDSCSDEQKKMYEGILNDDDFYKSLTSLADSNPKGNCFATFFFASFISGIAGVSVKFALSSMKQPPPDLTVALIVAASVLAITIVATVICGVAAACKRHHHSNILKTAINDAKNTAQTKPPI